jgi:uncharacterized membrane protein YhaH (DUF805 family)
MSPIEAFENCFIKIFDYRTRSGRYEFWWFYFIAFLIGLIVQINIGIQTLIDPSKAITLLIIEMLSTLPFTLAAISASCRRLHDTGKSGWLLLLAFTIIGLIPLFVWLSSGSDKKENIYGKPQIR